MYYIRKLNKNFKVLSEVGSKDANKLIPPYKWIELMQKELDAGSWKVIAKLEKEEMLVFLRKWEVRSDLIEEILTKINNIKLFGNLHKKLSKCGL